MWLFDIIWTDWINDKPPKQNSESENVHVPLMFESFCLNLAEASTSFLLWTVFRFVLTAPSLRHTPVLLWRTVVERVEQPAAYVSVLCPLAAPDPRLRDGFDAIMGPCDSPGHAGYGVCVPSQGQAVCYCPLQATVALWKAFPRLETVEDAEDSSGNGVQSCNAISCRKKTAILVMRRNQNKLKLDFCREELNLN